MGINEEFAAYCDDIYEDSMPQEFVSSYDILECLSSTNGCDTLLVRQKATGQKLVAKCYSRESVLFDQTESVPLKNMESEAVPHFMGEYRNEKYRCILREYVIGVSLREFVKTNRLTEEMIIDIAIKLANAIKVLHDQNPPIIHRDIKPQNIIIKDDGSLALIDFGISRVFKKDKTSDTLFCGTADFAPPEQFGFMQTDIRSDIYSFGVVLSWMITGRAKAIKKPLTKLERIAAKCCSFSPNKRYKNDAALLFDLHKITQQYVDHKRSIIKRFAFAILVLAAALLIIGVPIRLAMKNKSVSFQEPLIEEAVRTVLNEPNAPLTREDLENVTAIYIQANETYATSKEYYTEGGKWYDTDDRIHGPLRSIADLKNMPNLSVVHIGAQYISDITPLKNLEYLQTVDFRSNYIKDLSPLSNMELLSDISFLENPLNGIEVIRTLPSLKFLNLSCTGNYDSSPIKDLERLESLDIFTDSDAYKYLSGMYIADLTLGAAGQKDLECIRDVSYVQRLTIRWSDIRDISALTGRTDITYLNMESCKIDDLSPLFTIPNLVTVEMSSTAQSQIDELIPVYGEPSFEIIYL